MAKIKDKGWLLPNDDESDIIMGSAKSELEKQKELEDLELSLEDDKED